MKLIIGLGNPEKQYQLTRHNIGFLIVNQLAHEENANWQNQKSNQALISKININSNNILLAKPQTYMNLSGESVFNLQQYYQLNLKDILIIQDDLDLELGTFVFTDNHGHGGHNGIRSIFEKLNTHNINRLRIGIGRPFNTNFEIQKWVLSKFSPTELQEIQNIYPFLKKSIVEWCQTDIKSTMNNWNQYKKKSL